MGRAGLSKRMPGHNAPIVHKELDSNEQEDIVPLS